MNHNDNIDPNIESKAIYLGGCVTIIIVVVLFIITLLLTSCNGAFERKDPRSLTYREKVSDTDSSEIWRNVTYEIVSVSYDTVPRVRKERSTLEPYILAPKVKTVPDDKIDLNDYLSDGEDGIDWNYTELDYDQRKYLQHLGIYWDRGKECWRRK